MFDHPGHFLRRALRSGNDEITFVLPVFVVHYDEEFTRGKGGECVFNWVESERDALGGIQPFCGPPWLGRLVDAVGSGGGVGVVHESDGGHVDVSEQVLRLYNNSMINP
jgi:hypothetical protein